MKVPTTSGAERIMIFHAVVRYRVKREVPALLKVLRLSHFIESFMRSFIIFHGLKTKLWLGYKIKWFYSYSNRSRSIIDQLTFTASNL